jgi:hypothetical protein
LEPVNALNDSTSVANLRHHVMLPVEPIDRMYLNVYVPGLQAEQVLRQFFPDHRGQPLPSAALMGPISRGCVAKLESFMERHGIPLMQFGKGECKDAAMAEHLRRFAAGEGDVRRQGPGETPVFLH